jgi:hypothetical protein
MIFTIALWSPHSVDTCIWLDRSSCCDQVQSVSTFLSDVHLCGFLTATAGLNSEGVPLGRLEAHPR